MAGCTHETFPSQVAFSTGQPHEGSPETPHRERPDRVFVRDFFDDRLRFPDGAEHKIWSFHDDRGGRGLPGPAVRATEGELVHVEIEASKGPHTLHWHGIEPDPLNDGVGHTSYEVSGHYTYQWRPQKGEPGNPNVGSAGTYFYHCHVNTPLHVQMGMFGPLVVDPWVHPAMPPVPAGGRRPFVDGQPYDVATETLLVPYSVDPRWHSLNHGAGLSGDDVGLNRFDPEHFYVLGGELAAPPTGGGVWSLGRVRARVVRDDRLPTLLRINNANYIPTTLSFSTDPGGDDLVPIGRVIAHDGRPLRDTSDPAGKAPPLAIPAKRLAFGAAERYDVLLYPKTAVRHYLHVDWFHWVTRKRLHRRTIPIEVAPA